MIAECAPAARGPGPDVFREALTRFASGVTIVTTADGDNRWWGFTASSFCSLSVEPPLILVCLARSADSFPAFMHAEGFAVHVLAPEHEALARRFAAKGDDKFSGGEFVDGPFRSPALPSALASLDCSVHDRLDGGDHVILVGRVQSVDYGDGSALTHFRRAFHRLPHSAADASAQRQAAA